MYTFIHRLYTTALSWHSSHDKEKDREWKLIAAILRRGEIA